MANAPLTPHLKEILEQHHTLDRSASRSLLQSVLHTEAHDSQTNNLQIAALLGALAARGETPAEIAGFVDAMRAAATPFPLISDGERSKLIDTCGTGGDASGTFNISTAAALVAAAAGATVAKHGNRAITSQCGSADVLEALGIPVNLSPADASAALRRHRFAFLHAPDMHPAMKAVMPVRRALGVRTVFNILGPLTNPAGAQAQVMGVYTAALVPVVAEAMALLGTRHAFVVHGHPGMDEISISGPSTIAQVHNQRHNQPHNQLNKQPNNQLNNGMVTLSTFHPEDVGLSLAPLDTLRGGDATENAAILRSIFAGEPGPRRDVVLLNTAAVLVTASLAPDLPSGIHLAQRTIDSGRVTELLTALTRTSH